MYDQPERNSPAKEPFNIVAYDKNGNGKFMLQRSGNEAFFATLAERGEYRDSLTFGNRTGPSPHGFCTSFELDTHLIARLGPGKDAGWERQ